MVRVFSRPLRRSTCPIVAQPLPVRRRPAPPRRYVRGMRHRASRLVGPVTACLLLASCAAPVPSGDPGTLRTGEIRIPPKPTGDCAFDYRAAVSKVASDGTVVWSTDVPWADRMPAPVVMDGAVVQ